MNKKTNLQLFAAETNLTRATDIEPAISYDFTSRFHDNLNDLREVLGITNMIAMPIGSQINIYKTTVTKVGNQVGEGETIPLSKAERKLHKTLTLSLKKYRKAASIESIQQNGYENAVNETDKALIGKIQKGFKGDFFAILETGTASAQGANFQEAIANAWGKLSEIYEDQTVEGVYFVNSLDLADYIGKANITTQNAFGLTYIKDFIGLGTVIASPSVVKGSIKATVKENLNGAYVPASSSDISKAFNLTTDETGYIGMIHTPNTDNATVQTTLFSGVMFYPENVDGIVKSVIAPEAIDSATE